MRDGLSISMSLATLLALSACSKSSGSAETAVSGPTASSTPATAPANNAAKTAILATLPATFQTADLENGQAKFALCKSCHTAAPGGESAVGPNLYGVFGRKAGSLAGFTYSNGVTALGFAWDAEKVAQWITNPRAMVPGTKMTYAGMENPKDRTDVVAYLKVLTTPPPK
jgi:cytochrome c